VCGIDLNDDDTRYSRCLASKLMIYEMDTLERYHPWDMIGRCRSLEENVTYFHRFL